MTILTNLQKLALRILVLLALFGLMGARIGVAQTAQSTLAPINSKNILLLYSYGHGSKGLGIFDAGLLESLGAGGVSTNQLFFEFLDLERNKADPQYHLRLQDLLGRKYKDRHIDLVVTVQQPALNFLLHEGRELASGAPAITVQAPMPSQAEARQRRFVSLLASFDIKGTLDRALELLPDTRRVVFVSGNSDADKQMAEQAASIAKPLLGKLVFEYTTGLSLDAMLKRLASLPPASIIIFSQYNRGPNGRVTVAYEVEGMITRTANAPVFGLYDFNLSNGGMGGSVVSVHELGSKTGQLALDILNEKLAPIPMLSSVDVKVIPCSTGPKSNAGAAM